MTMGTRIAVLNDGVLQQIDPPQRLYDLPNNIFVAGFIGSPAMNFFEAALIEDNGTMYADCKDFRLAIPESKLTSYKPYLGKEVIMGLRPEHIHDPEYPPPGIKAALIEAQIEITELMGNEVNAFFTSKTLNFMGRFDPRTKITIGMTKTAAFDMSRIHMFDKQTEQSVR